MNPKFLFVKSKFFFDFYHPYEVYIMHAKCHQNRFMGSGVIGRTDRRQRLTFFIIRIWSLCDESVKRNFKILLFLFFFSNSSILVSYTLLA